MKLDPDIHIAMHSVFLLKTECDKDDLFKDFRNTSNYSFRKKPALSTPPSHPLDGEDFKEESKELTHILSNEWTDEVETSSDVFQVVSPSIPTFGYVTMVPVKFFFTIP